MAYFLFIHSLILITIFACVQNDWVVYWVVIRCFRKLVRYFHRIYLDMGFRHEVYPLEWMCITSLAFSLPLEYFNSVVLILIVFPTAKESESTKINLHENFVIDLSLTYLLILFISLPYFLSTLVSVCRKRKDQLEVKPRQKRSKKQRHAHASDDNEDSC